MQSVTNVLRKGLQGYIDTRYPNWNLDAALRYLPVAKHLERTRAEQVLDVGSGGAGLALYWGRRTISLDLSLSNTPKGSQTRPVLGTTTALPFKNRSIEIVVSCDMLEHIPQASRPVALSEMIRVARRQIILAAPCGRQARQAEQEVARIYREKTKEGHLWLQEHLEYGLPEADELEALIRSLARDRGVRPRIQVQSNTNLKVWKWLFAQYFGAGPRKARLIRYYFLVLLPLLRHVHWGNPYRRIFFVDLEQP